MRHILDAGPLIAALNRTDRYHEWACETLARLGSPFHTCPEVLAEAAAMTGQPQAVVEMVQAGELLLDFDLQEQSAAVLLLLKKYHDRGMDLADACVVRMSELNRVCRVVTVDRTDFSVYRRNGRDTIPVLCPPEP
ncbi:MAG: pilus assembly protein [Planctomycetota bacterium]|nr:pilus assembly protein [Planctomycetota bacterium]